MCQTSVGAQSSHVEAVQVFLASQGIYSSFPTDLSTRHTFRICIVHIPQYTPARLDHNDLFCSLRPPCASTLPFHQWCSLIFAHHQDKHNYTNRGLSHIDNNNNVYFNHFTRFLNPSYTASFVDAWRTLLSSRISFFGVEQHKLLSDPFRGSASAVGLNVSTLRPPTCGDLYI